MYGKGTLSDEKASFPCSFLSAACYLKRDESLTCGIGETLTCTTGETLTSFSMTSVPLGDTHFCGWMPKVCVDVLFCQTAAHFHDATFLD